MKHQKGKLEKVAERLVLRFERSYPHACEDVWRALVEPKRLADWFPARIDGERRAGAKLRFVFEGHEGPVLEGAYRVFEPPRLLEFSWDADVLRWELTPTASGCKLLFTTTVQQRSNAPRDATGWDACLDNLERAVAGAAPVAGTGDFAERYAEYAAAFGAGEFPKFLLGESEPSPALPNPALVGQTFEAASGARLALLHATADGETRTHQLSADAYLLVLEGSYVLRLGDQELALAAGTEFHVPGGGRVSGRVSAGTRLVYALAPAAR
jgi:uncharacterized protein YndB with AHSA1/START domain